MCDQNCIQFGLDNLSDEEIRGKRVLEVGSYNVNGSLRAGIMAHGPSNYIGVDMEPGPGVDVVCNTDDLLRRFGENSFNVVVSTCALEHVENWKKAVSNMKRICVPGGVLLIIVPSAYRYHDYPKDYWRFSIDDMKQIFGDCEEVVLVEDSMTEPERLVYAKFVKPLQFKEADLTEYEVESIAHQGPKQTLAEIYSRNTCSSPGYGDKGSVHSYIDVYERLLAPYRNCKAVLEIGVGRGHSLKMWEEYFDKAKVYGVNNTAEGLEEMIASGKHNILVSDTLSAEQVEKDYGGMKFDVIIEDASHILDHSLTLYKNFKDKVAPGGVYIIEDVADIDKVSGIYRGMETGKSVEIIDRRPIKGRFDDVLVVIGGKHHQAEFLDKIDAKFNALLSECSDMQGHMVELFTRASHCKRIVEFGVFDCTSTWALVASKPEWMRSYDIARRPEVDEVEFVTKNAGIDFKYHNESSLWAVIEPCDLLMIDSLHTYDQLRQELELHADKAGKYIILHDTTIFGNVDQTGEGRGLWPAVEEFLAVNKDWYIVERFTHCYGLTVLGRVGK